MLLRNLRWRWREWRERTRWDAAHPTRLELDRMTEARGLTQGFDSENEARRCSREMAKKLIDSLKAEGFTRFAPPLVEGGYEHGQWDEFADCRILVAWIEPHAFTSLAGKFAVRVDTLARR